MPVDSVEASPFSDPWRLEVDVPPGEHVLVIPEVDNLVWPSGWHDPQHPRACPASCSGSQRLLEPLVEWTLTWVTPGVRRPIHDWCRWSQPGDGQVAVVEHDAHRHRRLDRTVVVEVSKQQLVARLKSATQFAVSVHAKSVP